MVKCKDDTTGRDGSHDIIIRERQRDWQAELVRSAMAVIGTARHILRCDSCYPKDCVKRLIDEYPNLILICNARKDAALYELPPEKTGEKGRLKARGKRVSPKDFALKAVPGSGYSVFADEIGVMISTLF